MYLCAVKLIIDIGNTVAKLVAFEGDEPIEEVRTSGDDLAGLADFASKYKFEKGIVGSVKGLSEIAEQALRNLTLPFPLATNTARLKRLELTGWQQPWEPVY